MYDYVDGKVDWMAFGLTVEGEDGPFLGERLADAPTCDAGGSVADARRALDGAGAGGEVLVLHDGLVVGAVDGPGLDGRDDDEPLLGVMQPVPSTVRPSVTVASVAEAGGGAPVVTTSDGRLLGVAAVDPADGPDPHEGHDHDGHDHDDHGDDPDHEDDPDHDHDPSIDMEQYEQELGAVMQALGERFGDREPSAEEVQDFLRERLLAEGRSPEEADQLLQELGGDDGG